MEKSIYSHKDQDFRDCMYRDQVQFNGGFYNLRLIDFGDDWGVYFVASIHLEHLLWDDEHGYTCEQARYVDELIFYFIPAHYFKLDDDALREKILDEIV